MLTIDLMLGLGMSLAGSSTQALQALPQASPQGVFPPPGATVPLNAQFLVLDALDFVRVTAEGRIPLQVQRDPLDPLALGVLDVGALVAGESLVLEAECEGCVNTPLEFRYSVSNAEDALPPAFAPQEAQVAFGVDNNPRLFSPGVVGVHLCIPIVEPNELVLVSVRSDAGAATRRPPQFDAAGELPIDRCVMPPDDDAYPGYNFYLTMEDRNQSEFCFSASAADAAGNVGNLVERCVPLEPYEEFEGCASTPPEASTGLAILGLLMRRANRRRSG